MSRLQAPNGMLESLRVAMQQVAGSALPPNEREIILGDLEELHRSWIARDGRRRATAMYVGALMASVGLRLLSRAGAALARLMGSGRRWRPGTDLSGGLKQALRSLRRQPGLVLVATLTLGAGLGSAAAVFSVINELLLRPLPGVTEPGDAAYLEFDREDRRNVGVSGPVAQQIREAATLAQGIATFDYVGAHISDDGDSGTEIRAYTIYGEYFELLGVRPAAGRLLVGEETGPDADPFRVVISERMAVELFGAPEGAAGRRVQLNGHGFTVVGVAGEGFRGTARNWQVDAWVPRSAFIPLTGFPAERLWATDSELNQDFVLRPIAGASLKAVETEINSILDGLSETGVLGPSMDSSGELEARLHPGLNVPPSMRSMVDAALGVLSLAGLLILIIPCANVANLLIVRALNERGQMAVRRALGASRARIVGQALTESLLLALLGAAAGAGVALLIGSALQGEALWGLPALEGFTFDWRVWTFALTALVFTALVSGTVPAIVAARFDPAAALKDAGARTTGRYQFVRHSISTVQVALSVTLLVGSVLLARTVWNVYAADLGLDLSDVYVASVNDWRSEGIDLEQLEIVRDETVAALLGIDGVAQVALHSFYGPYNGFLPSRIIAEEQSLEDARVVASHWVTPGWFDLFDVQPVSGRVLRPSDLGPSSLPSMVLTSTLAETLFGTTNVVGRTVRRGIRELEPAVVVGVVGDLRLVDPTNAPDEAYFMVYPGGQATPVTVLVETEPERPAALTLAKAELERIFPGLSVSQPTALGTRIDEQIAEQRLLARMLVIFSAIAVLLSGVGLYGVMAFAVQGRTRELGIRMALGASGSTLARLVFRSAGTVTAAGITLGFAGAYSLSQLLQNRLFGVEPLDPAVYLSGAAVLMLVALLSGWGPLRTAMRIDISDTLRQD